MKLTVTKEAARWYKNEMGLSEGDFLRFFVKLYGGGNEIHPNFSLGVAKQDSDDIAISHVQEGITFYFDEQDEWFIEGIELRIELKNGEAKFNFEREEEK